MSGELSHAGSAQGLTHQGAASCTKPIHKAQAELASKAAPAKRTAHCPGVQAKGVTTHSDLIAEAIIATVNKHGCDLIVMASHGRRGISRLLLGSETTHVLTHSPVPVLVLR